MISLSLVMGGSGPRSARRAPPGMLYPGRFGMPHATSAARQLRLAPAADPRPKPP